MFRRIRQLRISLAAKCQLLFGAAVVLIIGSALFVPWKRMEQLTDQINMSFARGLTYQAARQHDAQMRVQLAANPSTRPTLAGSPADPKGVPHPKLTLLWPRGQRATLPRFEERAARYFLTEKPTTDYFLRQGDQKAGRETFHYAWPVYMEASCLSCHVGDLPPGVQSTTQTAAASATKEDKGPLLGLVSIEVPAQVESFDVLLNRIFLVVAGLLAGTLAIGILYMITTRLILHPVRVLQETAEKVSEGNLDIRSHINTGDEFQQLSETFNRMLIHMKDSQDQLRAINKSLDLKLGQLEESNVALYESNRLKSEFLANVSHELRTPLNSILGFAELLRDSAAAGDPKVARYTQNILSSGRNLLDLINDLLDLAKIEAGRMEVRSEPLSLNDLFEGLTSILKPLAEKKDLSIVVTVAPDVPILQTDPPKLQQVLYNFLSNAIKFSPPGGRIDLRADRVAEDSVRISVRDQGPGISPEKQSMIFEKFRQLDGSVTREHGGTGLGLSISKELSVLMGGSIGLESQVGEGALFWVTIPLKIEASSQDVRAKPAVAGV